jgi:hypothetical protein
VDVRIGIRPGNGYKDIFTHSIPPNLASHLTVSFNIHGFHRSPGFQMVFPIGVILEIRGSNPLERKGQAARNPASKRKGLPR